MRTLSLFDPETRVCVVAPASPPHDPNTITAVVDRLGEFGCSVTISSQAYRREGYLAGSDDERAAALAEALADDANDIIYCLRGGYGSVRLLSLLDPNAFGERRKVVIGFSDITTLHTAFFSHPKWEGLHGPDLFSLLKEDGGEAFRLQGVSNALNRSVPFTLTSAERGRGVARGELIGGNLSNLAALCGTPFAQSYKGRIVFFEEVQEAPYRIDRYLTQLLMGTDLQDAAGIVIGQFSGCHDPHSPTAITPRPTWRQVVEERLQSFKSPILFGVPFGHVPFNATLPIGRLTTLNAEQGELRVEAVV